MAGKEALSFFERVVLWADDNFGHPFNR